MWDLAGSGHDYTARSAATAEALSNGVDAIYQGALLLEDGQGLPDFLVRANLLGARHPQDQRGERGRISTSGLTTLMGDPAA